MYALEVYLIFFYTVCLFTKTGGFFRKLLLLFNFPRNSHKKRMGG